MTFHFPHNRAKKWKGGKVAPIGGPTFAKVRPPRPPCDNPSENLSPHAHPTPHTPSMTPHPPCARCGARLSQYRKPSDKHCSPCERTITDESIRRSLISPDPTNKHQHAFILRWRGMEWASIQHRLNLTSPGAAQRAAQHYARKHELKLP
jgi:hypothetical protein